MAHRDDLIRKRANEIFDRENNNPELTLDLIYVTRMPGRKTKGALPENDRQKIYIHPGRIVRERPWSELGENEYKFCEALYVIVLSIVNKPKKRPRIEGR